MHFNNDFNTFFVNIGSRNNNTDGNGFNEYFGHEQFHNFNFDTITNNETIRTITKIESKHSCGHDSISIALLKQIKTKISPSITLIGHQYAFIIAFIANKRLFLNLEF